MPSGFTGEVEAASAAAAVALGAVLAVGRVLASKADRRQAELNLRFDQVLERVADVRTAAFRAAADAQELRVRVAVIEGRLSAYTPVAQHEERG